MDSDLARRICNTADPFITGMLKKISEEEAKVFYGRNKMSEERAMEMRPVGKRVLLEKDDAPETSEGGILLPSDSREQPLEARVLAAGDAVTLVSKDDMVIFPSFSGTTFSISGREVIVLDEDDIMLVLREVVDETKLN